MWKRGDVAESKYGEKLTVVKVYKFGSGYKIDYKVNEEPRIYIKAYRAFVRLLKPVPFMPKAGDLFTTRGGTKLEVLDAYRSANTNRGYRVKYKTFGSDKVFDVTRFVFATEILQLDHPICEEKHENS